MADPVVVVGSGSSGVHLALSLLEKGRAVLMLDVGRTGPEPVNPQDTFRQLKENLEDPARYFLGEQFQAVVTPGRTGEYYGFPPSKDHVFAGISRFPVRAAGFEPLSSFAMGGLAEAWTGGVYAFTEDELEDFPYGYEDLAPYYDLVAGRIGISGARDDLSRFFPEHAHLMEPLKLDEHARLLLERYEAQRDTLNRRSGCFLGRSRHATLSRDLEGRRACGYLGRCLWGCPTDSLYTPRITLRTCQAFTTFTYQSGRYVSHIRLDGGNRVAALVAENLETGETEEIPATHVVLAAGTLSSSRIFLESLRQDGRRVPELPGLMDNRQVLMPFVNPALAGRPYDPDTYQYHQLAMGLEGRVPKEYVHAQITTLKTTLLHPIVQSLPLDLRTSLFVFRNLHAALGLLNINFHDTRRPGNALALSAAGSRPPASDTSPLAVRYRPDAGERARLRGTLRTFRRALRRLGCIVPPGMTHVRPMGASVHYAGTLPASRDPAPLTTSPLGESHDIRNLYFADGTTMPFLPAKNLTFTLMANAARIADQAF